MPKTRPKDDGPVENERIGVRPSGAYMEYLRLKENEWFASLGSGAEEAAVPKEPATGISGAGGLRQSQPPRGGMHQPDSIARRMPAQEHAAPRISSPADRSYRDHRV